MDRKRDIDRKQLEQEAWNDQCNGQRMIGGPAGMKNQTGNK